VTKITVLYTTVINKKSTKSSIQQEEGCTHHQTGLQIKKENNEIQLESSIS
jgi:hypothetical protein